MTVFYRTSYSANTLGMCLKQKPWKRRHNDIESAAILFVSLNISGKKRAFVEDVQERKGGNCPRAFFLIAHNFLEFNF